MCLRPIADKYHEGKVKRTLKRELKVPELAEGKANGISDPAELSLLHALADLSDLELMWGVVQLYCKCMCRRLNWVSGSVKPWFHSLVCWWLIFLICWM